MKRHIQSFVGFLMVAALAGCVTLGASGTANQQADSAIYKPVRYSNAAKAGPTLIVLPGAVKSHNATFVQRYGENNIADYAELELGKANFNVLERSDLGPMLDEINLAVNMGDPKALSRFRRGKFKSTRWFVRFDVLKAEQVARASAGFDGQVIGSILGTVMSGRGGAVTDRAVSSTHMGDSAGVWIVGMRYKIMDAATTEQVATGYFEDRMEVGANQGSFMGISQGAGHQVTLDTMVQRLIQQCVAEIDQQK
jgi:curli biogenesis system outer membrane secretion channel CsgG